MSGVYYHIPFCKTRCHYCDFYSTINSSEIVDLVCTLKAELWFRRNFLNDRTIKTIYFGGGTPSLLSIENISDLIRAVYSVYSVDKNAEITLEANPDDFSENYLKELKNIGINRLSIGIQSFYNEDLEFLGRRHNADQALEAVEIARKSGFKNISIDLIYGIPGLTMKKWKKNLEKAFELDIQHLSAYHLTYHENTKLWSDLENKKFTEIDEHESIKQFETLRKIARENGFEFYEVSNFAKKGFYSKHNSAYWDQVEYIGIGPSAHSYNTDSRYWNCSNISGYKEKIKRGLLPGEQENLGLTEKINDYILTRLRTRWGIDLDFLSKVFGENISEQILIVAQPYIKTGQVIKDKSVLILSDKGYLISDKIISDLFITSVKCK